jgi:DNA-directed RNA polymerase subunit RPC12/RpoP
MIKQCKRCGRDFELTSGASRYCVSCTFLGADVLSGKVFDHNQPQVCERCKRTYYRDRKTKYCSTDCGYRATLDHAKDTRAQPDYVHPEPTKHALTCTLCGTGYFSVTATSKACPQCRNRLSISTKRKKLRVGRCAWCGVQYSANGFNAARRFCSDKCNDAYNNKIRRARNRAAYVAPVLMDDIVTRDQHACQLCGKRVLAKHKYPHPLSASLDHILPIAAGGTHEPKNVQLAHLRCNLAKGVKACHEQLRMC